MGKRKARTMAVKKKPVFRYPYTRVEKNNQIVIWDVGRGEGFSNTLSLDGVFECHKQIETGEGIGRERFVPFKGESDFEEKYEGKFIPFNQYFSKML